MRKAGGRSKSDAGSKSRSKTDDGGVIVIPNKMKESHASPGEDAPGLCLANPCRVMLIGGCGAGKSACLQSMLCRGAMWKPWDGGIYLMAPTEDVQQGEYPLIDTTFLKEFPSLEYFKSRPGRAALVLDDVHLHDLSTKGSPSQSELCNRICGHLSTHKDGGLSVFIANQVWTAVPPSIRKLCSHFALFPNRIARDSIGHIARGVLLTKQQLESCCDMCTGQYDWLLITNEPDGRARVRINGVHPVPGVL